GAGGGAGRRGLRAGTAPRRGPGLRPHDDQDPIEPGMEHGPRPGDRGRSAGPGDLHADRRLPPLLRGLRGDTEAGPRGQLMADRTSPDWPSFEPRHRSLAERLDAWAAERLAQVDHADTDAACRELVAMLGQCGWLTHTAIDPADPGSKLDVRTL